MMSYQKRQPSLTDTDVIWFGKHKGKCLQDVSSSYLKWLYGEMEDVYQPMKYSEGLDENTKKKLKLYNYIHSSMDTLRIEEEDRAYRWEGN